jgi:hypothetical protein
MIHFIQALLPYVVLFYVLDCFIYLKKHQTALTSHFGKKYYLKKAGLRFIGLSPFCRVFITLTRPIFFSQDGVYIWNKPELSDSDLYDSSSFYHVFFEQIKNVECDGTHLTLNNELSIDLYSPLSANSIAERILFLKQTPSAKRLDEINPFCKYDTDLKEIKKITSESNKLLSLMELLSALLFVYVFALIPAGLYFEQLFYLKFLIISTASVCFLIIILSYWHLEDRFKLSMNSVGLLMHLVLFPVSTIHVTQHLTRHFLAASDFLAVSAALLSADDFRNILKKELKRIHYSKMKCKDNELLDGLKLKEQYLHRFLPIAGLTIEDLFKQPRKRDISAAGYCPLCELEYIEGIEICPDCDIELIAYLQNN